MSARITWTAEAQRTLLDALFEWVNRNGRLPPIIKTTKGASVPDAWKDIAKGVASLAGLDGDKAGKACSLKWTNIRHHLNVRELDGVSLDATTARANG